MTSSGIIKAAQYLSRLTAHQDPYRESCGVLVRFFDVDMAGFGRCTNSEINLHNKRFSPRSSGRPDLSAVTPLIRDAVRETLAGGFIATRTTQQPQPAAILTLPIRTNRAVDDALFVCVVRSEDFGREEIDIYLAVSAIIESNIERIRVDKANLMGIFESIPDPVHVVSRSLDITYANPAFTLEFGDHRGRKCFAVVGDRDEQCRWCRVAEVLDGKTVRETRSEPGNGKTYDVISAPLRNVDGSVSVLSILRDITHIVRSRQQVERLLADKELLLREVHHRIKNNMATMKSLLALQQSNVEGEGARNALQDAENRLSSMMVLYDRLYRTGRIEAIDLKEFLEGLVEQIMSTFTHEVRTSFDIPSVKVPALQASPLAIAVNELVTNAMKYAFTPWADNRLTFAATQECVDDRMWVSLSISDSGENFDPADLKHGFGLSMVDSLMEQLGGCFTVHGGRDGSATFVVRFPVITATVAQSTAAPGTQDRSP